MLASANGWDLSGCVGCFHGFCARGTGSMLFTPNICPIPGGSECIGVPGQCQKQCDETLTADWWRKDRTYICTTPEQDFADIRRRAKKIKGSTVDGGGAASYRDLRKDSQGSWLPETQNTITIANRVSTDTACVKACKTRRPVSNNEVTVGAVKSAVSNSATTWSFYYKECANDVCPAGDAEEILKSCQCLNDFADAAVIMQTIRLGAQDLICSDGTRKSLH